MDKDEEFAFVVARPWDNTLPILAHDNICIYTYGSEIQNGNIESARNFLSYVKAMSDEDEQDYKIYKISIEVIE